MKSRCNLGHLHELQLIIPFIPFASYEGVFYGKKKKKKKFLVK